VVKHTRLQRGKYANIAVLEGDTVKVIDEACITEADCPPFLGSLLGLGAEAASDLAWNVLVQLCMSMRAHGHGGALLVVPNHSDRWHRSVVWPVRYLIEPPYRALSVLADSPGVTTHEGEARERFRRAIGSVGGVT